MNTNTTLTARDVDLILNTLKARLAAQRSRAQGERRAEVILLKADGMAEAINIIEQTIKWIHEDMADDAASDARHAARQARSRA